MVDVGGDGGGTDDDECIIISECVPVTIVYRCYVSMMTTTTMTNERFLIEREVFNWLQKKCEDILDWTVVLRIILMGSWLIA